MFPLISDTFVQCLDKSGGPRHHERGTHFCPFMTLHHSQEVARERSIPPLRYPMRGLLDGPQNIWLHETLVFLSFWSPQRTGMTQRRKEVEREGPGVSWWLFSSSLSLPFVFQRELLVCESLCRWLGCWAGPPAGLTSPRSVCVCF